MTDFPDTRYSLILQLSDASQCDAWFEFERVYRPVIYRIARRKGLQESDAQDLVQQVLLSVSAALKRWEKVDENTRFRHWLRRVTRNAIINALTRKPLATGSGNTAVQQHLLQVPDSESDVENLFDVEQKRELFSIAARKIQADVANHTWDAFRLTVIDGISIESAASKLEKSVGVVYAARSRIMARLQTEVARLAQDG